MIPALGAFAFLVLFGYPPARLLTGERVVAWLAAPVATAVLCTIAGGVCLVLQAPMVAAAAMVVLCSGACTTLLAYDRQARLHGEGLALHFTPVRPCSDSIATFALLLGGVIPFFTVLRAPSAWDARSIWWFHAKWWAEGGDALLAAMRDPAFAFSHADYPPLVSATTGVLWSVLGGRSLDQAQFVTAVIGLSAASMLGYALVRIFTGRLPQVIVVATGALLVAACYGFAGVDPATNGYVDFLWSVNFGAAAVFLLASPPSVAASRWGALMLMACVLTKNEALIAGLVLAVLAGIRYRDRVRALAWIAVAVAPGVLWLIGTRIIGAYSDAIERWRTSELLSLDHEVTERILPSMDAVMDRVWVVAAVTATATALGMALRFARTERRAVSGSSFPWMWIAWALIMLPIVVAYVVSSYDLDWHLLTSITRTTLAPNVVLLAELSIWTLTFLVAGRAADLLPRDEIEETARHQPVA